MGTLPIILLTLLIFLAGWQAKGLKIALYALKKSREILKEIKKDDLDIEKAYYYHGYHSALNDIVTEK